MSEYSRKMKEFLRLAALTKDHKQLCTCNDCKDKAELASELRTLAGS